MTGRVGITSDLIFETALKIVDEEGLESLSIRNLARKLNIQAPSLYNHISSIDELRLQASLRLNRVMIELARGAISKSQGRDRPMAVARGYREFALAHPGLFRLSTVYPRQPSADWEQVFTEARKVVCEMMADVFALSKNQSALACRSFASFLVGFITFEIAGGIGNLAPDQREMGNPMLFEGGLNVLFDGLEQLGLRGQIVV